MSQTSGNLGPQENLGRRPVRSLPQARFPDVDQVLSDLPTAARAEGAVDVLLVNPPAPDGAIWIRSQHRVGRRSRENMIWPQVSLALRQLKTIPRAIPSPFLRSPAFFI